MVFYLIKGARNVQDPCCYLAAETGSWFIIIRLSWYAYKAKKMSFEINMSTKLDRLSKKKKISHHDGLGKLLDGPIPNNDYLVLHSSGIVTLVAGIISECLRKKHKNP